MSKLVSVRISDMNISNIEYLKNELPFTNVSGIINAALEEYLEKLMKEKLKSRE